MEDQLEYIIAEYVLNKMHYTYITVLFSTETWEPWNKYSVKARREEKIAD